jgi:hypothetical protein
MAANDNCLNYECTEDVGQHLPNECGEELLGGGSGCVLFECNTTLTDPTNATQVLAEIAAGRATLIDGVKIGLDLPSPVEIDSNIVGATQTLVTYNRSGTLSDGNVNTNNVNLYDIVGGGRKFGAMLIYIKGTEESNVGAKCFFINAAVQFTGGLPMKNNNDEIMTFQYVFKWRKKTMQSLDTAPAGVFN